MVGMGRSFYENSALARSYFDRANEMLPGLRDICFDGPEERLTETSFCQPALYVTGYAIFKELETHGHLNQCSVALGLSLGELTALAVAEVYSFETGLQIVAERGRLMQEACNQTSGAMASLIGGSLEEATVLAASCDVDIANINCPGQVVLSGEKGKIAEAVRRATAFKRAIPLNVAGAYHSRLMEPARKAFEAFLSPIPFAEPRLRVLSNVTGDFISDPEAIRQALVQQVVSTVRWDDCMRAACTLGIDTFYECGPNKVLAGLAKRIDKNANVVPVETADALMPSLSPRP